MEKIKERINVRKELLELKRERSKIHKEEKEKNEKVSEEKDKKSSKNKKSHKKKSKSNISSIKEIEESLKEEQEKLENLQKSFIDFQRNIGEIPLDKIEYPKEIHPVKMVSRNTTKQVLIAKPPKILAFHFQRSIHVSYSYNMRNNSPIKYPEYLNIRPWCTNTNRDNNEYFSTSFNLTNPNDPKYFDSFYRLQSAVYHFGSHDYGHFIAYRRVRRGGSLNKDLQDRIKELISNRVTDYSEWEKIFKKPEYVTSKKSIKSSVSQLNTNEINSQNNINNNNNSNDSNNNINNDTKSELDEYQWFRISDSSVELIIDPEMELFNSGSSYVYMLFYESLSEYNLSQQDKDRLIYEEKRKFKEFKNEMMMNTGVSNKSSIVNPFDILNSTVSQNSSSYRSELNQRSTVDEDDVE